MRKKRSDAEQQIAELLQTAKNVAAASASRS